MQYIYMQHASLVEVDGNLLSYVCFFFPVIFLFSFPSLVNSPEMTVIVYQGYWISITFTHSFMLQLFSMSKYCIFFHAYIYIYIQIHIDRYIYVCMCVAFTIHNPLFIGHCFLFYFILYDFVARFDGWERGGGGVVFLLEFLLFFI